MSDYSKLLHEAYGYQLDEIKQVFPPDTNYYVYAEFDKQDASVMTALGLYPFTEANITKLLRKLAPGLPNYSMSDVDSGRDNFIFITDDLKSMRNVKKLVDALVKHTKSKIGKTKNKDIVYQGSAYTGDPGPDWNPADDLFYNVDGEDFVKTV